MLNKKEIVILLILLILLAILRIPSLFEPYWYRDEGITLTVGQALRNGAVLYRDIADNKTPLLYFLAALFPTIPLFKGLLLIWMTTATIIFYLFSRLLIKEKGFIISSLIFVLLTSLPILEGNIINGEVFFLLPNLLGMYLGWKGYQEQKQKYLLLSGLFFGLGFLFKPPALFDMGAFLLFLFLAQIPQRKQQIAHYFYLGSGFLIPNTAILLYFYLQNALADYWEYAYRWNFLYASGNNAIFIPYGGYILEGIIIILVLGISIFSRSRLSKRSLLIVLWLLSVSLGSVISPRHYVHYFIPLIAPLALTLGLLYQYHKKIFFGVLIILIIFWNFIHRGSFSYQKNYYKNFFRYITKRESVITYRNSFDKTTDRAYHLADYLKDKRKGPIFIWGDEPFIYVLSGRQPAGRFPVDYNIHFEKKREQETIFRLNSQMPVYILTVDNRSYSLPGLDKLLNNNYNFVEIKESISIYERKN